MEDEIISEKRLLRKKFLEARERIPETETRAADAAIASYVFESGFYRDAKTIFVYISVGREVDTFSIIRRAFADGKTVSVPRTGKDRRMEAVPVGEEEFFTRAFTKWPRAFGIPEPPEGLPEAPESFSEPPEGLPEADVSCPDLVIAPSLALDRLGYRLGYGGGFFDCYISAARAQKNRPLTAAVQRSIFVQDEPLPRESYDMAVDLIITENGIVIPASSV